MKTLKIEIPNGFEIENFDIKTGVVKFKETPKDIKERIKTFSDVLNYFEIDEDDFNEENENLENDEVAYRKLKLITKALNEGWKPDWSSGKYDKWFAWFDFDNPSSSGRFSFGGSVNRGSDSHCGSRLCFKSSELAKYAGKQFEDIYRRAFTI